MVVISDEAVDKYSKVKDVNNSNCESVKVQLQDTVSSNTMDDVVSCSIETTGDEGQIITNNNADRIPRAALQYV